MPKSFVKPGPDLDKRSFDRNYFNHCKFVVHALLVLFCLDTKKNEKRSRPKNAPSHFLPHPRFSAWPTHLVHWQRNRSSLYTSQLHFTSFVFDQNFIFSNKFAGTVNCRTVKRNCVRKFLTIDLSVLKRGLPSVGLVTDRTPLWIGDKHRPLAEEPLITLHEPTSFHLFRF